MLGQPKSVAGIPRLAESLKVDMASGVDQIVKTVAGGPGRWGLLRRGGAPLLALPSDRIAAARTLSLYQPQSRLAKWVAAGMRVSVSLGLHRFVLPGEAHEVEVCAAKGVVASAASETGVLFGSREHRVKRAVVCRRSEEGWEVCKIAFGTEGSAMLQREAAAIRSLSNRLSCLPRLLGIHDGGGATVLRMPYVEGEPVFPCGPGPALELLNDWWSSDTRRSACEFPEWEAIESVLIARSGGLAVLDRLGGMSFRPSVRHGDLARWNLRRTSSGKMMVLDWEWAAEVGMPGLDLVHFVCQDLRLVDRLPDREAIMKCVELLEEAAPSAYLKEAGWEGETILAVVSCIAFKQGAGHQENGKFLDACLSFVEDANNKRTE